jgi:hypothetical protein
MIDNKILPFEPRPRSNQTPPSTIDAFKYLVRLREPERLKAWLADRPQDAPTLLKLLENK